MKKTILTLLVIITFLGCSKIIDNSKENIALVEQYIKAVENLDSETMGALLADDYIGYGPSYGASINKENAIKNWKESSANLYKSIKYTKSRNIAVSIPDGENKGEWVTNWAELTIVYKKDEANVTLWANTLYQIENGKVIKSYTIYNEADALNQLGYIFVKE
jgi:hypothetical protein